MSRYRPPTKPSSPFITIEGYTSLTSEYDFLWKRKRPEVVRALSDAAAEGDRSENAEYQYRKRQLAEIDRRVRYLQKRLPNLKVIREKPADTNRVFFSASVTLIDDSGVTSVYRIVGADEIDPKRAYISIDSPMAKSLLGKQVDDVIRVETPAGVREFEITIIEYP